MGRLDTALNGKNGVLYGHKKITYEVPCADCPNPHDCPTGQTWDPIKEECVKPTCEPEDPGYECNCECDADEICIDGACRKIEPKICGECHRKDPNTGDCVFDSTLPGCGDEKKCPEGWLEDENGNCYCEDCQECESPCYWDYYEGCVCPGPDKKVCGECYSEDPVTGECIPDPTKCPEECCPEGSEEDPDTGDCIDKVEEEIIDNPTNPETSDCFDFTRVGDGATVNADGKTTGLPGDTKRNGIRYWYSTLCYEKVEFFARITTVGEGVNKSGIEHGYAETKGDMSYVASAYFGDYVQMHHDDVLKVILYADGREETYIKSFIRPGIWSGWEVFSNIKRPETPPSGKIAWMVVGVLGGAEIWDVRGFKYQSAIPETDAIVENVPQNLESTIQYRETRARGTVRDANDNVGPTMWFGWENPSRWANGETKRYYCTYKDGVLTVPRDVSGKPTKFSYIGTGTLPAPYTEYAERHSWFLDIKFKLIGGDKTGKLVLYWGKNTGYDSMYMPLHTNINIYSYSELYNKELRLVTEAYYCGYGCIDCYSALYYWTGDGRYNGWELYNVWEGIFQLGYWVSSATGQIELVLDSSSSATGIEINYASEGYAY